VLGQLHPVLGVEHLQPAYFGHHILGRDWPDHVPLDVDIVRHLGVMIDTPEKVNDFKYTSYNPLFLSFCLSLFLSFSLSLFLSFPPSSLSLCFYLSLSYSPSLFLFLLFLVPLSVRDIFLNNTLICSQGQGVISMLARI